MHTLPQTIPLPLKSVYLEVRKVYTPSCINTRITEFILFSPRTEVRFPSQLRQGNITIESIREDRRPEFFGHAVINVTWERPESKNGLPDVLEYFSFECYSLYFNRFSVPQSLSYDRVFNEWWELWRSPSALPLHCRKSEFWLCIATIAIKIPCSGGGGRGGHIIDTPMGIE